MSRLTLAARWIVPVDGPPVENGRLVIEGGCLAAIERSAGGGGGRGHVDIDYGDAAILPGLVNAHTHLELSAFRGRLGYPGSFTGWLRGVVSLQTGENSPRIMDEAMGLGLEESLAAGVTMLADIGCGERAVKGWSGTRSGIAGFFEAIGMGPRRDDSHPRSLARALAACEAGRGCGMQERIFVTGISPHAPYSTAPEVYAAALGYCRRHGLPICTHLAETPEEGEFLARGTGPFRELLEERGLWDGSFEPPGCSPVAYAGRLGLLAARALLAHVNYASDGDIALLARHRCSVVYCPRTHRFFEHAPHRYREMLSAGLNVCLGTDSLASSPDLSILGELRFLRAADPFPPDDLLLEMATLRGARALGLEDRIGTLAPGRRADLVVIPVASSGARPLEDILRSTASPAAVYLGGGERTNRGPGG
jgi:cytosine/adenosine deaminase-related metal-dependent hydrolase